MSPDFNIYSETILIISFISGVLIGGKKYINLRYADDTVVIPESVEKLQSMVNAIVRPLSNQK